MEAREDKPFPVRLNDLKAPLHKWAMDEDRSIHYIITRILRETIVKKFGQQYQRKKKIA